MIFGCANELRELAKEVRNMSDKTDALEKAVQAAVAKIQSLEAQIAAQPGSAAQATEDEAAIDRATADLTAAAGE
jgi:septal ring factor EnvC (AmiA/AmiB activator)